MAIRVALSCSTRQLQSLHCCSLVVNASFRLIGAPCCRLIQRRLPTKTGNLGDQIERVRAVARRFIQASATEGQECNQSCQVRVLVGLTLAGRIVGVLEMASLVRPDDEVLSLLTELMALSLLPLLPAIRGGAATTDSHVTPCNC